MPKLHWYKWWRWDLNQIAWPKAHTLTHNVEILWLEGARVPSSTPRPLLGELRSLSHLSFTTTLTFRVYQLCFRGEEIEAQGVQVHIIHKQQDQDTQKSFLAPKPEIFLLVSINREGRKGQLFCQSWIQLQRQAKSLYLFFAFDSFFSFLWNVVDFQYCVTFRYTAKWFDYTCIHIYSKRESNTLTLVTQLCQTLCDPMDCNPPGSSVHGILQARILEWVAIPFSRIHGKRQKKALGVLDRWNGSSQGSLERWKTHRYHHTRW